MEEQIFILNNDNSLVELNEKEFINESQLQELLSHYPKLISGSQIDSDKPRKWLLISREIGLPDKEFGNNRWALDHLFIDQDGIPTLVEVKRSTDTRIRREVVGQMLDYAANAVLYWSIDEIKNSYERYCERENIDPAFNLQELLGEDKSVDDFWERVNTNLRAGKIRLIFVADKIPKELQRIIEFLNEQMNSAEVLGLEIKQFGNETLKTLVPKIIGQTSSAQIKKRYKERRQWTEESFYEELKRREGELSVDIVKNIIDKLKGQISRLWFGQGKRSGSIVPTVDLPNMSYYLFAIWTYGKIEIYFQWYKDKPPFNDKEKRLELLRKLNTIKGVKIPENRIDKRPSFPIQLLKEQGEFNKFIDIYKWFLKEVKMYG